MDNLTKEQRHRNMQNIKSKDTRPEMLLRKILWKKGWRYRKNVKDLPGKPDIVFPGKKLAVFIDGEFWHGFQWEIQKEKIKTRRDYWIPKIEKNMQRDREADQKLKEQGWQVIRFWSKEVMKDPEACAEEIIKFLKENQPGK